MINFGHDERFAAEPYRHRAGDLNGATDRTEPIVGLYDRSSQHRFCLLSRLGVGKGDHKVQFQICQPVASIVSDLVATGGDVEPLGL